MDAGYIQEQKLRHKIGLLQLKLRFYEATISNVVHDLEEDPNVPFTILVLKEALNDKRYPH